MNPDIPTIRGLIQLHKQNYTICPTVKCWNAPGYKLAKFVVKILYQTIQLTFTFNVKNLITLMNYVILLLTIISKYVLSTLKTRIKTSQYNKWHNKYLITLNINSDIYQKELLQLSDIILSQNYYQFN